ncbi:MAG: VCBS repeat-containing protein, partial [Taibaiella sp.]|nr:VCBS repeat-containing protein [Taibaiella sp.]
GSASPIAATIPAGTAAGTAYRIRVINLSPTATFGTNNGSNIIITGAPPVNAITGPAALATGNTAAYANTTTGGTWSVSNTTVATITASGMLTGLTPGTDTIFYSVVNTCGITGTAYKVIAVISIPAVTSVIPNKGIPGTPVTISGANFNLTYTNNIVYFGGARAVVTAGTTTSLTVTVPVNAAYAPVTVTDSTAGFTSSEDSAFTPYYNNTGLIANATNFKNAVNFNTGSSPLGTAIADIDGDGKSDFIVINSGLNTLSVFKNIGTGPGIGSGTFASPVNFSTSTGPHYLKIADIDGDGRQDIIVANTSTSANKVSILRNTSTPASVSFAAKVDYSSGGTAPIDIAIADFDADGKPDIAVVNQNSARVSVLRNMSSLGIINTTSFATAVSFNTGTVPFKVFAGDLDGDGKPDLAVTNYISGTVSVFHNTATPGTITSTTFATPVSLTGLNAPTGIAAADIDGDNKPEIIATNSGTEKISIFKNTFTTAGTLSFATKVDFTTDSSAADLTIADINGDGKADIAVANFYTNKLSVFLNLATTGTINTTSLSSRTDFVTGNAPSGMASGDIDGDGKPDIIVVNNSDSTVSLFRNYPVPPISPITGNDSICNGTSTMLSNATTGGTWINSNPSVATISASGMVTSISPGTDTISYYTVAQGDTNIVSFPFRVDSNYTVAPIVAPTASFCIGALLHLTDSVASGRWVSSDTTIATVDAAGFISGRSTGTVIVTYSITNTCGTAFDTITINVTPASGYTIGAINGPSIICQGANITYTDTSAGGSWQSGDTTIAVITATGVVTGGSHGTTIITYGFTGSCGTYLATKIVTVDTAYNADSFTGPSSVCVGSSISLTNGAGSGGTWRGSNASANVSSAGILTGLVAGTDTVIYTISNVCGTAAGRKSIVVNPLPQAGIIIGSFSVCPTDTIFISSTVAGGTWRVTNTKATIGAATGRVIGVSAGIDTALYIVSNGCGSDTAVTTVTILQPPSAGTISGASAVCVGSSVTLRDTTGSGVWAAKNGFVSVADSVVTGIAAGIDTIYYTVTNSCGTATAIRKITVNPVPFVDSIAGPGTVCTGTTITLTNSVAGGIWSKTNNNATVTAGVVKGITAGIDTILYTVTVNGCPSVAAKVVTIMSLSAGVITSGTTVCVGAELILRDTTTGGVWDNTNHFSSLRDSVLTGIAPGVDTVSYTVTSSCGSVSATKRITVNAQPEAGTITGISEIVTGDTVILRSSSPGGVWLTRTSNTVISATGAVGALREGADTILYIVSNTCGKDTARFAVNILQSSKPGTIKDIVVTPNPNNGVFKFNVSSRLNEAVTIVVSNSVYQVLDLFEAPTNTPTELVLDYAANGVYYISAISKQGWYTVKFVLAR